MTLFDSLKEKIRSRYRVAIDANTNLVTVSKQCEVENYERIGGRRQPAEPVSWVSGGMRQ